VTNDAGYYGLDSASETPENGGRCTIVFGRQLSVFIFNLVACRRPDMSIKPGSKHVNFIFLLHSAKTSISSFTQTKSPSSKFNFIVLLNP
jgi:hypothetical protein